MNAKKVLTALMVAALAVIVFATNSASAQQPVTSKILVQEFDDEASKALAATFEFLGWGNAWNSVGQSRDAGSATLIRNNAEDGAWVLTAGHAVQDRGNGDAIYPRIVYGFSPDSLTEFVEGGFIEADLVVIHPLQDLALVRLSEMPLNSAGDFIEPIQFYDGDLIRDMSVLFAGYGDYGLPSQAGPAGTGQWDGFARVARGRFDRTYVLNRSIYLLEYDTRLELSGLGANGDSGGFAAVEDETGKPLMVGVNNMILGTGETAATGIEYLRYDPNFFTWLEDTIAANRPDGSEGEGEGEPGEGEGEGSEGVPFHSGDTDGDWRISLSELLRIIQFFNMGGYHCADEPASTEDGYLPGENAGQQSCIAHTSDYAPQDWSVSLSELLRSIQLFNTGTYHACPEGEDGFCVGAATT